MGNGNAVPPIHIRCVTLQELPAVIDQLDKEFIFNKNRSLSLSVRFPHALSSENIDHILVAATEDAICGTLVIREFEWAVDKYVWPGALIGMVWVDPQHRGRGIGSKLLRSAKELLCEENVMFGVLWTGTPAFYERAGWFLNDRSLFGEAAFHPSSPHVTGVLCRPLTLEDAGALERLRSGTLRMRVLRSGINYRVVPMPAVEVLCFSVIGKSGIDGFALVGEQDGIGYLYELIGPPSVWNILWSAVAARFDSLFVNGHSDDPFSLWLAENKLVVWRPQEKAMWLRVSACLEESSINTWHIPYFDWI